MIEYSNEWLAEFNERVFVIFDKKKIIDESCDVSCM